MHHPERMNGGVLVPVQVIQSGWHHCAPPDTSGGHAAILRSRADEKRQVLADQEWRTVEDEDQQNKELLDLSNQILDLTKAIHAITSTRPVGGPAESRGT
jgi:hypothetical protein